jgi:AAHS family 4-hydroxybenzoate transporter-like MFS transporter
MATRKVSVTELFDDTPFTSYQAGVCLLCFSVMLLDGFDLTVIGVALPKIAEFLHSDPKSLGMAVGAGQLGPLVGAIVLGMLADRLGRKSMLFICAVIFGLFTLLTAYITSVEQVNAYLTGVEQLAVCRFLAGIGLGGAIPNALAFGCEYAPSRLRASLTTMMWVGMPIGSIIGGLSAAFLLPHFGWQTLFVVGGASPVLIGALVAAFLPESLAFLVRKGADPTKIRKVVARISPTLAADETVEIYSSEQKLAGVPVKHLFTEGRVTATLLLWTLFFFSFYLLWIMLSWAPTLLRQSGATVRQYSLAFACINLGAAIATIIIGRLMDRLSPFLTLKIAFIFAFISVALFGLSAGSPFIVVAVVCVITGIFVMGGNSGIMALATVTYPLDIRASGIGAAYAVGKLGSMLAPMVGGVLLSWKWSVAQICFVNALTALFVLAAIIVLQRHLAVSAARAAEAEERALTSKVQVA